MQSRSILIVEDNDDAREALRMLLELDGYAVEAAAEGLQALEIVRAKDPDVALVDIGLPGIDGYEVARRLRQSNRDPSLKIIAVTGYGQPSDLERSRAAGFDDHIVKPMSLDVLRRLLDDHGAVGE